MSGIDDVIQQTTSEALSRLQGEADKLQAQIAAKEEAHHRELEPLRADLAKLETAISQLRGDRPQSTRAPSERAPRGHNRTLILDYLQASPDSTAAEVTDGTAISKATVHATLHKLHRDGVVSKDHTDRGVVWRLPT